MTAAGGHHGEIRGYEDLHAVLRRVAELRDISRETIDEIAGLARGYASKVLAEVPLRRLGPDTLGPMLGAVGIKLLAVDDETALARYTARADKRRFEVAVQSGAVHFKISLRKLKRNGRKGGKNSRKFVGKRKARMLGRKAAKARWHKPKPIKAKGSEIETHIPAVRCG